MRGALDGVLLLDKPRGITSQAAVTRVKHLLGAAKAGHTGTLDPMATGLLPVAFGEATKFSQAMLEADKGYTAVVRLGVTTTTGDLEGEVTGRAPVTASREQIDSVLPCFRGEIQQIPPMYSALKHAGKPLYAYARAGTDVPRAPRRIHIASLEIEHYAHGELRIEVTCSKGTYIRVLAEDIGAALGCGACLAALTRTKVGPFGLDAAIALDVLSTLSQPERLARLLPVDAMVAELPRLELDRDQATRLLRGQPVVGSPAAAPGLVRIYGPDAAFLGLAEAAQPDRLVARRLVAAKPANA